VLTNKMEDYGELKVLYYVTKSSGMFSRGKRVMGIYERGVVFMSPTVSISISPAKSSSSSSSSPDPTTNASAGSDREGFSFGEPFEVSLSERREAELTIKTPKQTFTLACLDRLRLATDLFYFKAI
jgi:hypothetical protein